MGIKIEFNPDLVLRNISEHKDGNRKIEECIPQDLEEGKVYEFLKAEQRNFYFHGEVALVETKGNEVMSRPKAGIIILEATHFLEEGKVYTRGKYRVVEVFHDDKIYFENFFRVKKK